MAKHGLDYFPLNVDFFEDDKIEYVTARFDEKGELITIKLMCAIYRNGYYTDWNTDKAMIFAKRAGKNISPSLANDVVNELVKREFFDESIFNSFGILTSRGIQKRFLKVVTDLRNEVTINGEYWVIDSPNNTKKTTFIINPPIFKENRPIIKKNQSIFGQSKVKESKVKESKVNNIAVAESSKSMSVPSEPKNPAATAEQTLIKYFLNNISPTASKDLIDKVCGWTDIFPADVIIKAIDEAVEAESRNYRYIAGILRTWQDKKLFTLSTVEGHLLAWQNKQRDKQQRDKQPTKPAYKNKFINYEQRKWDYDAIERAAQNKLNEGQA